jgi:hypothetical protein
VSFSEKVPDIGQGNSNWISFLDGFKSRKVYENVIKDYAQWQNEKDGDYVQLLIQYFDYLHNLKSEKDDRKPQNQLNN